jgi:uncharacterized protein
MTFFCRLLPPRPTFGQDMTGEEARLMQEHAAYWNEWLGKGHVVAFGVVGDPAGVYGVGIVEFDADEEVRAFTAGDPTIRSGAGFSYEIHPMPFGVVRAP